MSNTNGSGAPSGSMLARSLRLALLALAAIAVLAVSACGSSNSDKSSSSSSSGSTSKQASAPKPKGAPIKVMTMTSLQAQNVPTYENIKVTAETYAKWINAKGGIKGRPLDVTVCDDRGDPTQATACARKAVSDGDVASVGSFTFFGDAAVPVFDKADTAWFGICCAQSAAELTSKNTIATGATIGFASGLTARMIEDGCKTLDAAMGASPRTVLEPIARNAAKAYGRKFDKIVTVPDAAQDLSPQVAEVLGNKPDCVLVIFGESSFKAWMPAWQQAGTKARMYGPQGNLNQVSIKGYEQAAEGSVIGGPYPDISTSGWKDFRDALKQNNASSDLDFNSLGGLGTWSGYEAFRKIVEGMSGPINHKTFLAAASKATVEVPGEIPKLDFTKEWTQGPKGFARTFNCAFVTTKIQGGKVVPDKTQFQNAAAPATGAGKLGAPGQSAQCADASGGA